MIGIPLMSNNIIREDAEALIRFLQTSDRYTQGSHVMKFEEKWSEWLGVRYSLFVNSGSSANYITMAALHELYGEGEVIVSPIGWMSDVSSIMAAGMKPVFADVKMETLSLSTEAVLKAITEKTRAVMLVHVLGFNGLTQELLENLKKRNILLIEDVCESHGATFREQKLGTYGYASNFSFYYAHHMSTIEGGMICTNDDKLYQYMRMFRSHGMIREVTDEAMRRQWEQAYPDIHPEFMFTVPGYNVRSTELNAVIGLNQIQRLDKNIQIRKENFSYFLDHLDSKKYFTEFDLKGNSNYALIVILRSRDSEFYERLIETLKRERVEFRRGTAGGGNLARQPFIRNRFPEIRPERLHNAEYIHNYGLYVGNFPDLQKEKIDDLCNLLNTI